MRNVKEINIKNRTPYFFDDMINIKDFDSNLLKIDKKSYKKSYKVINIILMFFQMNVCMNYKC